MYWCQYTVRKPYVSSVVTYIPSWPQNPITQCFVLASEAIMVSSESVKSEPGQEVKLADMVLSTEISVIIIRLGKHILARQDMQYSRTLHVRNETFSQWLFSINYTKPSFHVGSRKFLLIEFQCDIEQCLQDAG